jgi:putative hydrolase of the HAD superfamily
MRELLDGIRLITIDLDDTLWPCAPVIRHAEESLYRWLETAAPVVAGAHDLASLREHRRYTASLAPHRAHDLTWLRREHLRLLLTEHGYAADLADEGVRVFRRARNRVQAFEDVAPVLDMWRARYVLVSLTNGNVDLHRTPLGGFFHHHVDAAMAGAAKPDPAMFLRALAHAGVEPQQALHLGDDPLRDISPARALGMRTVWVNRTGAEWPADMAPADGEVKSLNELPG